MNSSTQNFTQEQILLVQQLLNMSQSQESDTEILTDETDSELSGDENSSDSGGDEQVQPKRGRGRPKKILTEEQIAARAASKARGRGRPRNPPPTEEEVAAREQALAATQSEKQEKYQARVLAKAKQYALHRQKKTEIYKKMIADAEEYRLKWELSSF